MAVPLFLVPISDLVQTSKRAKNHYLAHKFAYYWSVYGGLVGGCRRISAGSAFWTNKLARWCSNGENTSVAYIYAFLDFNGSLAKTITRLNIKPWDGELYPPPLWEELQNHMVQKVCIYKWIQSKTTCNLPAWLVQVYFIPSLLTLKAQAFGILSFWIWNLWKEQKMY